MGVFHSRQLLLDINGRPILIQFNIQSALRRFQPEYYTLRCTRMGYVNDLELLRTINNSNIFPGLPILVIIPWIITRLIFDDSLCWTTHKERMIFLIIRIPIMISNLVIRLVLILLRNFPILISR